MWLYFELISLFESGFGLKALMNSKIVELEWRKCPDHSERALDLVAELVSKGETFQGPLKF